jgi:ubiquinone/menaquinone biosynthesis C-methylase UbiE
MDEPEWTEGFSQDFIDYGRYFVPDREDQIQLISSLIPPQERPFDVLELACGEGLLAEAILTNHPHSTVYGYDGSTTMLAQAKVRLARFGERFKTRQFDLLAKDWRQTETAVQAVVSSLAIHHLDGPQKQQLFQDIFRMLAPGGVFIIADLIQPVGATGLRAAAAWDAAVKQRAVMLDGDTAVYDQFQQSQWNIFHYPDPMDKPSSLFDQLKWLEAAGFAEVDVYWLQAGHALYGGKIK